MPVYRPAASSILRSFLASGKRHLLLTGGRGSGKTTLLRALMPFLCPDAPMLLTAAVPGRWVEMRDTAAGVTAVIGRFDATLPPGENRMRPVPAGFAAVGLPALQRMAAAGGWAVLDELGYLESGCADFQQSVLDLLKICRVLAVVRKQDTPFLHALCADPDAFVYDLDCPVPPLGCIVMASGLGRRFGGNKLMAELNGRPLAVHALALAAAPVFAGRIAVTRSAEVEALCRAGGFPVLRHAEPRRSDTVRLGLTALLAQQPDLQGCVFLPGDQPCLTRQTLEALAIGAAPDTIRRPAAPDGTPGSPVLFGRDYFAALLHLPQGCGGSAVLRAHPQAIRLLPTPAAELRDIDTRSDLEALRRGKG